MEMPNSPGILHGDDKFSREFCMGIPNSLGNFAWGSEFDVRWEFGTPESNSLGILEPLQCFRYPPTDYIIFGRLFQANEKFSTFRSCANL